VRPGTAERDAKACALRRKGLTYDDIAAELGFRDRSAARKSVKRALGTIAGEPAAELVTLEAERLDELTRCLYRIVATVHYVVTPGGKLARHPDTGEPLADPGPVLAALRELRAVSESRRRLLGLDAPAQARIEVLDNAALDAEMLRIAAEFDELGDHDAAAEARQAVSGRPYATGQ